MPISIEVPEGASGLTPRLALTYSSQSRGNGPYGFGWGLSIGSITMSTTRGGQDWNSSRTDEPRYSMDVFGNGGELVEVAEAQNNGKKTYHTLQESFFRVQPYEDKGWIAWDKAGVQYQFEQYPAGSNKNILYLTSVISPTLGWISVRYTQMNAFVPGTAGMVLPSAIWYGALSATGSGSSGNPCNNTGTDGGGGFDQPGGTVDPCVMTLGVGISPSYIIEFKWKNRWESVMAAMFGELCSTNKILDSILVEQTNGTTTELIRKYVMGYTLSSDSGKSLLTSVEEIAKDTVSRGLKMTFGYTTNKGKGNPWGAPVEFGDTTFRDFSGDHGFDRGAYLIDLDGDTIADQLQRFHHQSKEGDSLVEFGEDYCLNEGVASPGVDFGPCTFLGGNDHSYSGWFTKQRDCTYGEDPGCPHSGLIHVSSYAQLADMDGDGRVDTVAAHAWDVTSDFPYPDLYKNAVGGITDFDEQWHYGVAIPFGWISESKDFFVKHNGTLVLDLNGDGLGDFIKGNRLWSWKQGKLVDDKLASIRQTHEQYSSGPRDLDGSAFVSSTSFAPPTPLFAWNGDDKDKDGSDDFPQATIDRGIRFADLNGDGLVDMIGGNRFMTAESLDGGEHSLEFYDHGSDDLFAADRDPKGLWFNTGAAWSGDLVASTSWRRSTSKAVQDLSPWAPDPSDETNITPSFAHAEKPGKKWLSNPESWQFVDVNGDGLADLVISVRRNLAGDPSANLTYTYMNRGGLRWERRDDLLLPIRTHNLHGYDKGVRFADIDGDGMTDIVKASADTDPSEGDNNKDLVYFNKFSPPDLLNKVTTPLGAITDVIYKAKVTPHVQIPGHIIVPEKIVTRMNASSAPVTQKLEFEGPVISDNETSWPQARKFLGFTNVLQTNYLGTAPDPARTIDPDFGTSTEYFTTEDLVGKVKSITTWEQKPTQVTRKTSYAYHPNTHNGSSTSNPNMSPPFYRPVESVAVAECNPYCSEKEIEDSPHRVTEVVYEYDNYGNVTQEKNLGDINDPNDNSVTDREYVYNIARWIVGNVKKETLSIAASRGVFSDLDSQPLRTTLSYYDNLPWGAMDKGLVTRKEATGDKVPSPGSVTEYKYDFRGNLETEKNVVTGETVTNGYDPIMGLFKIWTKTSLGTTNYGYYGINGIAVGTNLFGKLASVSRPDGTITNYLYDPVGRLAQTTETYAGAGSTDPLPGTKYQYVINPLTSGGGGKITTLVQTAPNVWLTVKQNFLDGLGRTYRTTTLNEEGQMAIHQRTQFRPLSGKTWKVSKPVEAVNESSAVYTYPTETFYDSLGRVTKITSPLGNVTSSYQGTSVISTDEGGQKTTTVQNSFGKPTKVTNFAGNETNYTYDPIGRLVTIKDSFGRKSYFSYDGFSRKLTATTPDTGTSEWTYDEAGNLETETDANGNTVAHSYDSKGREIARDLNNDGTPELTFGYDTYPTDIYSGAPEVGEMTSTPGRPTWSRTLDSLFPNFSAAYYDKLGRTKRERKNFGDDKKGMGYQTRFSYDTLNRVTKVVYPAPMTLTVDYVYNSQGLIESIPGWVTSTDYDAMGRATSVTYANRERRKTEFDPATERMSRLKIEKLSLSTDTVLKTDLEHGYTYYPAGDPVQHGELASITDNVVPIRSKNFQYDNMHRLTQENSIAKGLHVFSYSADGNISSRTDGGVVKDYAYGDTAHPHAVTSFGTKSYTYNANGDVTKITDSSNGSAQEFRYTPDGKVINILAGANGFTTFSYDAGRNLVRKYFAPFAPAGTGNQTNQIFVNPYLERIVTPTETKNRAYILLGSKRIGVYETVSWSKTKIPPPTKYWQHGNHQGSIELITNAQTTDTANRVVDRLHYSAFGETEVIHEGGDAKSTYRFSSMRIDEETGLYDFGPRMYDPKLGRFLQSDSIIPDALDSEALNPYSYSRNNPIRYIDPSGHGWGATFAATTFGFIVGGIMASNPLTAPLAPMVGGMVAGGLNAYWNGGDAKGVLIGATMGFASALAGGMIGAESPALGSAIAAGSIGYQAYKGQNGAVFTSAVFYVAGLIASGMAEEQTIYRNQVELEKMRDELGLPSDFKVRAYDGEVERDGVAAAYWRDDGVAQFYKGSGKSSVGYLRGTTVHEYAHHLQANDILKGGLNKEKIANMFGYKYLKRNGWADDAQLLVGSSNPKYFIDPTSSFDTQLFNNACASATCQAALGMRVWIAKPLVITTAIHWERMYGPFDRPSRLPPY